MIRMRDRKTEKTTHTHTHTCHVDVMDNLATHFLLCPHLILFVECTVAVVRVNTAVAIMDIMDIMVLLMMASLNISLMDLTAPARRGRFVSRVTMETPDA